MRGPISIHSVLLVFRFSLVALRLRRYTSMNVALQHLRDMPPSIRNAASGSSPGNLSDRRSHAGQRSAASLQRWTCRTRSDCDQASPGSTEQGFPLPIAPPRTSSTEKRSEFRNAATQQLSAVMAREQAFKPLRKTPLFGPRFWRARCCLGHHRVFPKKIPFSSQERRIHKLRFPGWQVAKRSTN